jgi:tetratricopeptide (TPR) repeat protein
MVEVQRMAMEQVLKTNNLVNLGVEKLIREASDNFTYNRDYELALEQIDSALEIDGNHVRALILKGDILFCMDLDKEALEHFEMAINADPLSAEAYGSKAGTLDVLGNFEDALKCCEKAFSLITVKDKFLLPSLYDQKLTLLLRMRKYEDAKRILSKAVNSLSEDDADYLRSCYHGMIESSCKIRRKKLAKAEKISLKVI